VFDRNQDNSCENSHLLVSEHIGQDLQVSFSGLLNLLCCVACKAGGLDLLDTLKSIEKLC